MRRLVPYAALSILFVAILSPVAFGLSPSSAAPGDNVPIPPQLDIWSPMPIGPDLGDMAPNVDWTEAALSVMEAEAEINDIPRIYPHTVVEGDTLWDIAEQHGVNVDTVIGANPDISPNVLKVGQVIKVPSVDGAVHVVKAGDTVSSLASKYKAKAEVILKANNITDPSQLTVGQELIVPGATPTLVHKVSLGNGRTTTVSAKFRWPVSGAISSRYGWRWGRFHHGIDIAAPYGRTIVAARAGKVIVSGWQSGYGYTVVISHGDGVTTLYGHASKLLVSYGDWVDAGQAIARVGSTGNSTGPHCHFEVRVDGSSLNPLDILQ